MRRHGCHRPTAATAANGLSSSCFEVYGNVKSLSSRRARAAPNRNLAGSWSALSHVTQRQPGPSGPGQWQTDLTRPRSTGDTGTVFDAVATGGFLPPRAAISTGLGPLSEATRP